MNFRHTEQPRGSLIKSKACNTKKPTYLKRGLKMQTFRLPARGNFPPFFFLSPKDGRQTCRGFKGPPLECTEGNCIHVPEKEPTSLFLPSCYSSPAPSSIHIQPEIFLFLFFFSFEGLQIQGPGSFWGRKKQRQHGEDFTSTAAQNSFACLERREAGGKH